MKSKYQKLLGLVLIAQLYVAVIKAVYKINTGEENLNKDFNNGSVRDITSKMAHMAECRNSEDEDLV